SQSLQTQSSPLVSSSSSFSSRRLLSSLILSGRKPDQDDSVSILFTPPNQRNSLRLERDPRDRFTTNTGRVDPSRDRERLFHASRQHFLRVQHPRDTQRHPRHALHTISSDTVH